MSNTYKTIGIIGAMAEEIERLNEHVAVSETIVRAGIHYYLGTLHGHSVIYCKSGVGKVNAAVCTQVLIDLGVDCVLFTGVAGAIDSTLRIGDIVISKDCLQHDMDVRALGFARGQIPYQAVWRFVADDHLVQLVHEACVRTLRDSQRALIGTVLSGDQFIASRNLVKEFRDELQGACVEMEGAALAQVCQMNKVPFVVIRSMSDQADGSAHVNFATFTIEASNLSYAIVDDVIRHL